MSEQLQRIEDKVDVIVRGLATVQASHANLKESFIETRRQCDSHERKVNMAHGMGLVLGGLNLGSMYLWLKGKL